MRVERLLDLWWRWLAVARSLPGQRAEHARRKPTPRHLTVVLERDDLDGGWVAECLELPGCVAQGESEREVISNIIDAVAAVIAIRMEDQVCSGQTVTGAGDRRRLALTV
jgi:predicted RNase H-like HicB family nuclease